MKHVFLPLLALVALASCRVVPVGPLPPDPRPLSIYTLELSSNLKTPQGQSVICDDRYSYVTYSFYYYGSLESWTSWLRGERTGRLSDPQTFTRFSPRITVTGNYVRVTYEVPPRLAPLSLSEDALSPQPIMLQPIMPQSIIIAPAPSAVIGYSSLSLVARDPSGVSRRYSSNALPVLNRCY